MPRTPLALAAFSLSFVIFAAPAEADDWTDCKQNADPGQGRACSVILGMRAVVSDGEWAANAWNNRGLAFYKMGMYDVAIAFEML
jgi:hypothetical protein